MRYVSPMKLKDPLLENIRLEIYNYYDTSRPTIAAALWFAYRNREAARLIYELGRENERDSHICY